MIKLIKLYDYSENGCLIAIINGDTIISISKNLPFYNTAGGILNDTEMVSCKRRAPQWARKLIAKGIVESPQFHKLIK